MVNISRFYKSRYETAEKYARKGERQKCLDICWELRLAPDLSLYRQACVNLLIASVVDVRTHQDCAKFANECIALVGQVRREFESSQESDEALTYLETHARTTLVHIHEMPDELQAAEAGAEDPLDGFEEITIIEEDRQAVRDAPGLRSEEDDESEPEETDDPDKPWTIEGMYTDHEHGHRPKAPLPEGDQQGQLGESAEFSRDMDFGMGTDTATSDTAQQNWVVENLPSSTPTILGDLPFRPQPEATATEPRPLCKTMKSRWMCGCVGGVVAERCACVS